MKAMIFAAGLGTRLKPITDNIPKALLEIKGKTLLEILLNKLKRLEINSAVVNVHHFAPLIVDYLKKNHNFGMDISISDESEQLLDTGGGLIFASKYFGTNDNILVHNSDILSSVNFKKLEEIHTATSPLISLIVNKRQTSRYFLFNDNNELCGWQNIQTGEKIIVNDGSLNLTPKAFSGISIINSKVFELYNKNGKFSIVKMFLDLAQDNVIKSIDISDAKWFDVGKINDIENIKQLDISYFL